MKAKDNNILERKHVWQIEIKEGMQMPQRYCADKILDVVN